MKDNHKKYIAVFLSLLIIIIIALILSDFIADGSVVQNAANAVINETPAPSIPSSTTPRIFVTHTIANPGQLPLRATIQIRPDISRFDEMSIFIDAGSGYEPFTCSSLPCEVARNYTQPGIVKYYAIGKSEVTVTDPANAPQAYKSFRVG